MTEKKPLCVSIGPFGTNDVEVSYREDLEITLSEALTPHYDYKPFWALPKIDMASDIFSNLIDADLVIADLRGLNPNVLYEIGLRHAFNKPVLHLIDFNTQAPWDIDKNYLIKYSAPLQVSQKKSLIDAILERIEKINEIRNHKSPTFNTFISHYKNAASVQNFQGESGSKEILLALFKSVESLTSGLSAVTEAVRDGNKRQRSDRFAVPTLSNFGNLGWDGLNLARALTPESATLGTLGTLTDMHYTGNKPTDPSKKKT